MLPAVLLTTDQDYITTALKEAGYFDIFMGQVERVKTSPTRKHNAIVGGRFQANGTVLYVHYHFQADDPGLSLMRVDSTDPAIIALTDRIINNEYQSKPEVLFIDSPEMRN